MKACLSIMIVLLTTSQTSSAVDITAANITATNNLSAGNNLTVTGNTTSGSLSETGIFVAGDTSATNKDILKFEPNGGPYNGGFPSLFLQPYMTNVNGRSVGMFCNPNDASWGNLTSTAPGYSEGDQLRHFACFNVKMGQDSVPIPAGTKGIPTGYQANINTDQA